MRRITPEQAVIIQRSCLYPEGRATAEDMLNRYRAALASHTAHMADQARWLEEGRTAKESMEFNIALYQAALKGGVEV